MTRAMTVAQLSRYIKGVFDDEELLHDVTLSGEVAEVSYSDKHTYIRGVERSRKAMEEAGLIFAVVDMSADLTAEDREMLQAVEETGKPWIFVASKRDLVKNSRSIGLAGGDTPSVEVSALTGEGLDKLGKLVAELFPKEDAVPYGQLLTNARQEETAGRAREAVRRAREALTAGFTPDALLTDVEEALSALGELTGQSVREDVTDRIFAKFCVGK